MSTYDFLTDFEDLFTLGFSTKPLVMHYSTPNTKDISPMSPWKKEEDNYTTTVRVVGIDPDDVEVSLEEYGICIEGKSETFGEEYSQELQLGISKETMQNIEEVKYEVKNGMCKITLVMKEPECRKISITKVE